METTKNYLEAELEKLLLSDAGIWQFIQEGSLDGFWYWDLENPEHEYMSPQFWRTFGFDPDTKEHLSSEWMDLIYQEDLETAKENLARHLADPDHAYDQVVRYRRADGRTAWVRCRGVAVRNEEGKPIRLLGAHHDITHQKESERSAAVAMDELNTIFNAASSGIVALDQGGNILRINTRARHMLGGISDPTPLAWPDMIRFLDAETLVPLESASDPIQRALSGQTLRSETHLLRRVQVGEERRYVRVASETIDNPHSNVHVVLVIDDVSVEERNRQVVERKSRLDALGQLTGGIAHDFNNLLASQLYAVDLVRKTDDEEEQKAYLDTVTNSVHRARSLTSRLLAFARRQPGLATARRTAEAFDEFCDLVRPMIEAQIEIKTYIEDTDLLHYCDQTQLETALLNLVLNSRDAILRSGRGNRIEVRARPVRSAKWQEDEQRVGDKHQEADGSTFRYVEISVSDNGPGMDAETLSRCTDPFFTTKETGEGTGLGLAMVYGFVRQSDGDFRIYSEEGMGTIVRMILPRGTEAGHREQPVPEGEIPQGNGERILLAEDEPVLTQMLKHVLQDLGYEVFTASSGQLALDLFKEEENLFDLLLTDIVMPGKIGGFELARRVRELRPDIPVIYTSGYTGFTASEMGEVRAPLIQKPAPPSELAELVALMLAEQK